MFPADSQLIGRTYLRFLLKEKWQLDKQGEASRQAGKKKQLGKEEQMDRQVNEEQLG
jgi:hypothetical protein